MEQTIDVPAARTRFRWTFTSNRADERVSYRHELHRLHYGKPEFPRLQSWVLSRWSQRGFTFGVISVFWVRLADCLRFPFGASFIITIAIGRTFHPTFRRVLDYDRCARHSPVLRGKILLMNFSDDVGEQWALNPSLSSTVFAPQLIECLRTLPG